MLTGGQTRLGRDFEFMCLVFFFFLAHNVCFQLFVYIWWCRILPTRTASSALPPTGVANPLLRQQCCASDWDAFTTSACDHQSRSLFLCRLRSKWGWKKSSGAPISRKGLVSSRICVYFYICGKCNVFWSKPQCFVAFWFVCFIEGFEGIFFLPEKCAQWSGMWKGSDA